MSDTFLVSTFLWVSGLLLIVSIALVAKIRKMQVMLMDATMHDHVTHALEWPYNEAEANRMVKHCERNEHSVSFHMLDGDDFRHIYDEYGPEVGHETMAALATAVTRVIREVDLFGRYGSGKFIICLPSTDLNGAVVLAERIRLSVAEINPSQFLTSFTVSIGCAEKQSHETVENVIRRANQALERARSSGGNRVAASKNHEAKSHKNAVWPNLKNL